MAKERFASAKFSDFLHIQELYRSNSGTVYRATFKYDRKTYVLKERKLAELGKTKDIMNEVKLLQQLRHVNVVQCEGWFRDLDRGTIFIVLEHCDGGDLNTLIEDRKRARLHLEERQIWFLFHQISLGIKHLHENGIIHRDIKALNVLLVKHPHNGSLTCKLADLGVSRQVSEQTQFIETFYGTPLYLSPELIENKAYNEKTDIWSLGILLYELLTFNPPFKANSLMTLAKLVLKGEYEAIPTLPASAIGSANHAANAAGAGNNHQPSIRANQHAQQQQQLHTGPTTAGSATTSATSASKQTSASKTAGQYSHSLAKMMKWLLTHDYMKRPSISQVLEVIEKHVDRGYYGEGIMLGEHLNTAAAGNRPSSSSHGYGQQHQADIAKPKHEHNSKDKLQKQRQQQYEEGDTASEDDKNGDDECSIDDEDSLDAVVNVGKNKSKQPTNRPSSGSNQPSNKNSRHGGRRKRRDDSADTRSTASVDEEEVIDKHPVKGGKKNDSKQQLANKQPIKQPSKQVVAAQQPAQHQQQTAKSKDRGLNHVPFGDLGQGQGQLNSRPATTGSSSRKYYNPILPTGGPGPGDESLPPPVLASAAVMPQSRPASSHGHGRQQQQQHSHQQQPDSWPTNQHQYESKPVAKHVDHHLLDPDQMQQPSQLRLPSSPAKKKKKVSNQPAAMEMIQEADQALPPPIQQHPAAAGKASNKSNSKLDSSSHHHQQHQQYQQDRHQPSQSALQSQLNNPDQQQLVEIHMPRAQARLRREIVRYRKLLQMRDFVLASSAQATIYQQAQPAADQPGQQHGQQAEAAAADSNSYESIQKRLKATLVDMRHLEEGIQQGTLPHHLAITLDILLVSDPEEAAAIAEEAARKRRKSRLEQQEQAEILPVYLQPHPPAYYGHQQHQLGRQQSADHQPQPAQRQPRRPQTAGASRGDDLHQQQELRQLSPDTRRKLQLKKQALGDVLLVQQQEQQADIEQARGRGKSNKHPKLFGQEIVLLDATPRTSRSSSPLAMSPIVPPQPLPTARYGQAHGQAYGQGQLQAAAGQQQQPRTSRAIKQPQPVLSAAYSDYANNDEQAVYHHAENLRNSQARSQQEYQQKGKLFQMNIHSDHQQPQQQQQYAGNGNNKAGRQPPVDSLIQGIMQDVQQQKRKLGKAGQGHDGIIDDQALLDKFAGLGLQLPSMQAGKHNNSKLSKQQQRPQTAGAAESAIAAANQQMKFVSDHERYYDHGRNISDVMAVYEKDPRYQQLVQEQQLPGGGGGGHEDHVAGDHMGRLLYLECRQAFDQVGNDNNGKPLTRRKQRVDHNGQPAAVAASKSQSKSNKSNQADDNREDGGEDEAEEEEKEEKKRRRRRDQMIQQKQQLGYNIITGG